MPSHAHAKRILWVATSVALMVLTLAGLAVMGVVRSTAQGRMPTTGESVTDVTPAHPSSGRLVVAVALGASGTIGSDALAPFEVFASSPAFSVYTVAASAAPAPVDGGPAIVPTYTFADVASGRAEQPDVVVVPAVDDPDGPSEAPLRAWVIEQSQHGARILGVCAGSRLLAATGLLQGRTATSHWSRINALKKKHPDVHWVNGERFVTDGAITTTAGITSGIPAALHLVDELAGNSEAARVGQLVHYPNWSPTASTKIPVQSFALDDLPVGLNLAIPWFRPTLGVALADGVGEIDVASAFEVYSVSYAARTLAIATGGIVTTEHGVVLATLPATDAPALDRVVLPAATAGTAGAAQLRDWADQQGLPVDTMRGARADDGFDAALEYLSATAGHATAVSAAKMIDYPTADLDLGDGTAGPRVPLLALLGLVVAAAVGFLPTVTRGALRRRRTAGTLAPSTTAPRESTHHTAAEPAVEGRRQRARAAARET
jgi:transcriptional regulator GlxA family with amidase domain